MTIWIDAQHSPAVAFWIDENFEIDAVALRDIGLRDARDEEISSKAAAAIFRVNLNCSKNIKKAKNEREKSEGRNPARSVFGGLRVNES